MKLLLLFVVTLTFVISCAGTSSSGELISSCAGITCSGHGTCKSNDGIPECQCEPGYINMGDSCVFDCSNVENSKVNTYNNSCECNIGFQETRDDSNALTACQCDAGKIVKDGKCVIECDDEHAILTASGQSCICDTGYISVDNICTYDCRNIANSNTNSSNDGCECLDGYIKDGDFCAYECNTAGNMIPNASNTDCSCKEGFYTTNQYEVCESPCENVTCESNSQCTSYDADSYICTCDPQRSLKLNYLDKFVFEIGEDRDFQVATNNGDSYAIVWSGTSEAPILATQSIYVALTDSNGELLDLSENNLTNPFIINGDYTGKKSNPSVVWGGNHYVVTWEDYRHSSAEQDSIDIYARFVTEAGVLEPETNVTFVSSLDSYAYQPKILWNEAKSSYAIFWKEQKRELDALGNTAIYFRTINTTGTFLINSKPVTSVNVNNYDFDVMVNQENDYSMVWTKDNGPRRLFYQIINSDETIIESSGVIKMDPINLVYNNHNSASPRILWNGSEYAILYKNSSYSNYNFLTFLNSNHQKINSEVNLFFTDTYRDLYWNNNEYIFSLENPGNLYTRKISWDGMNNQFYMSSDGLNHVFHPRISFISSNNTSVFWIDSRNGKYELYFSNLGCF